MNIVSLTRPLAYIAACGVIALGLATAPQAGAVTFDGNLADDEGGGAVSLTDITEVPGDFNASFEHGDLGGSFEWEFSNTTSSTLLLALTTTTINQDGDVFYFTDGVTTNFDGTIRNTVQGLFDAFQLTALVEAGTSVVLSYVFGDAVGNPDSGAGPDIDFSIRASVVPLPAGLVLFLTGLAGIGFLGRYKAKRREPEIA